MQGTESAQHRSNSLSIPRAGVQPVVQLSLAEARSLVSDLFRPNPRIYWTDLLVTVAVAYLLSALVQRPIRFPAAGPYLAVQCLCFIASSLLFYRATLFIHELVHLPRQQFLGFRVAWNLLVGIPLLVPSFLYYTHLDHHRRRSFGTQEDGEYIPLARRHWWHIVKYLAIIPLIPLAAIVRFALLTPLAWLHPRIRSWAHRHASSMVMDPAYSRPAPSPATWRMIFWQELGCFLFLWSAIAVGCRLGAAAIPFLVQFYLMAILVLTINSVRTLGAHRWWNDGRELSFQEQLLDSVSIEGQHWLSELWGPIGIRWHSLHHLFPSLPYHNLAEAHRRLMLHLPADSPYRLTIEPTLAAALGQLLRRSYAAGRIQSRRAKRQPTRSAGRSRRHFQENRL
jgi:fatty acid desaturase